MTPSKTAFTMYTLLSGPDWSITYYAAYNLSSRHK